MASHEPNQLAQPPVPQTPLRQVAEVLLIVLIFFIATGDPTPSVNETHYIARLKHFWNPQWCKGDLFLESTDTQVVFIWLFGWLTRCLSLSATTWVGRVVTWTVPGLVLATPELATRAAAIGGSPIRRAISRTELLRANGRRMGRRRRRGQMLRLCLRA